MTNNINVENLDDFFASIGNEPTKNTSTNPDVSLPESIYALLSNPIDQTEDLGIITEVQKAIEKLDAELQKTNIDAHFKKEIDDLCQFIKEQIRNGIVKIEAQKITAGQSNFAARYMVLRKKLILSDTFDADNLLDVAILLHEFVHIRQFILKEKELTPLEWEKYARGAIQTNYGTKHINEPIHEAEAYECEIKILDAMLHSRLSSATITLSMIPEILKSLGARSDQNHTLYPLLFCAEAYFRNRKQSEILPEYNDQYIYRILMTIYKGNKLPVIFNDGTGNSIAILPEPTYEQLGPSNVIEYC